MVESVQYPSTGSGATSGLQDFYNDRQARLNATQDPALRQHYEAELKITKQNLEASSAITTPGPVAAPSTTPAPAANYEDSHKNGAPSIIPSNRGAPALPVPQVAEPPAPAAAPVAESTAGAPSGNYDRAFLDSGTMPPANEVRKILAREGFGNKYPDHKGPQNGKWDATINAAAEKYGLDPWVLKCILSQESTNGIFGQQGGGLMQMGAIEALYQTGEVPFGSQPTQQQIQAMTERLNKDQDFCIDVSAKYLAKLTVYKGALMGDHGGLFAYNHGPDHWEKGAGLGDPKYMDLMNGAFNSGVLPADHVG